MKKKTTAKKKSAKEPSWDEIGKAIGQKIEKNCGTEKTSKEKVCNHVDKHGCGGAIYGLGFIGAAIYYISTATGFWMGVLGVLKALVWPAFLIYSLMRFLGM